jgi:hypothetical protein
MQEQDPEKLTYFIRQLNLALDRAEILAFPPTRRKSDAAAQTRFRAKDKQAHPELGRLDTAIAVLPELEGPLKQASRWNLRSSLGATSRLRSKSRPSGEQTAQACAKTWFIS